VAYFQSGLAEREAVLAEPSTKHLLAFFEKRIAEWPYPYRHEELATVGLFDDLVHNLSPALAFSLVPFAVEIMQQALGTPRFDASASLVLVLASASDTTELPKGIEEFMSEAQELHPDRPNQWLAQLKTWYRI